MRIYVLLAALRTYSSAAGGARRRDLIPAEGRIDSEPFPLSILPMSTTAQRHDTRELDELEGLPRQEK